MAIPLGWESSILASTRTNAAVNAAEAFDATINLRTCGFDDKNSP